MEEKRAAQRQPRASPTRTSVLLVRHGHTSAVGRRLVGRLGTVGLTDLGRRQAARLALRLADLPIAAIYTSPLQRAVETAEPLARLAGLPVRPWKDLQEIDFGDWTGLTFAELDRRADWRRFNAARERAEVPGGESARDVQRRILRALGRLRSRHPSQAVVAVSHAEVIRAAVLHAAGLSLDLYHRYEIAPASITALCFGERGWRLEPVRVSHHPPL